MHADFRMVENILEELDAPGEWFHDPDHQVLYFIPAAGQDLASARIEVVRLKHLIEFQGSAEAPVRHIRLQGFTFRHTARTFMETREPLLRSDWTIYRGGAVAGRRQSTQPNPRRCVGTRTLRKQRGENHPLGTSSRHN